MTNNANAEADMRARRAAIDVRMEAAARAALREVASVRLVAVSKQQPMAQIEAALALGWRAFGENRVQEAEARWAARRALPNLHLRLIGPLQTNKADAAVALFDAIDSLDRPKLAHALCAAMAKVGRRPDCLIQVNTGDEPQKAGVAPADLDDLVRLARDDLGLPVRGLMCIPPVDEEPAMHFALLAKFAARHGLPEVSMGMSDDFETAIAYGATMIRVGSALFGRRVEAPAG
jgi:pyridoxal phosphate enzyme (YggS family)